MCWVGSEQKDGRASAGLGGLCSPTSWSPAGCHLHHSQYLASGKYTNAREQFPEKAQGRRLSSTSSAQNHQDMKSRRGKGPLVMA